MKQFFIFIALIAFCSVSYAQTEDWLWAKQAGGTEDDTGNGIATDSNGSRYVTGWFQGTATLGSTTLTSSGWQDIFIAKLDTNGNYLWVKQAGGTNYDSAYSIATDSSGNCYVTGRFCGAATFGSTTLTSSEGVGIFIAKLDTNGNWLWAKQAVGTIAYDSGRGIATDSSGNSYVTGEFYGAATFGNTTLTGSGEQDIFIAKLDTNGNFLWAKQAGSTEADYGYGIATDSSGNCCVTGIFRGTAIFGNTPLTGSGSDDIFIAKLDTNGNWLWAKKAGGTDDDRGFSIATDSSGNCYVTGGFGGNATFGNTTLTSSGWYDIFIAKLGSSTGVLDEYGLPQINFTLGQNHPNPFTASTSFSLEVSDAKSDYEVSVYDLRGRHIRTLHRGVLPKGECSFTWNGKDAAENQLSSGVYFYRVTNGTSSQVKKMIYVR
jgi:hypothetical protein